MPGPVLFTQKRVGQNGTLFSMYKFRTMFVNNSGSTITIKGEMSLVGPRPDVPGYAMF